MRTFKSYVLHQPSAVAVVPAFNPQDCPYVRFDELKTDDAMSRLSRCRPVSGFRPAQCEDGTVRFAHNVGEVNFHRRAPLQLASTLGFILNNRSGKFMGLTEDEKKGGARMFDLVTAAGEQSALLLRR